MRASSINFQDLLTKFLIDYLPLQRGCSKNTILSYRDTFKLLLNYIVIQKGIKLKKFNIRDFNRSLIIEFLEYYREKGGSTSSANQRLAAIKSFVEFAQLESVEYIAPLGDISNIKSKKGTHKEISYLDTNQMKLLINFPSTNTETEFRHRLALTLLYDTGCRVQELCNIKISDVFVNKSTTIRLHGKGNKERTVIVSDQTGKLLDAYIKKYKNNCLNTSYLITNRFHQQIDRDGISYIINKYVTLLRHQGYNIPTNVHPHMFRHSKAMHMLEAGINIVYIRDFLGHEDISTTMIYVRSDNRLKDEAINKLVPKIIDDENLPDWKKDSNLMDFLNSLG